MRRSRSAPAIRADRSRGQRHRRHRHRRRSFDHRRRADGAARSASRLGAIDVLVVNTGGPPAGTFDSTSDGAWRQAFEGLWMSTVALIRGCLPGMRERRWGRIMIVTSISAAEPLPNLMISNALRPGLHGLLNALSREVAGEGVTVNAIMPGYTLTERLRELAVDEQKIAVQIPAGGWGVRKNLVRWRLSLPRSRRLTSAVRPSPATADICARSEIEAAAVHDAADQHAALTQTKAPARPAM